VENMRYGNLIIAHSPHIDAGITTQKIMGHVIIALLPALVVSGFIFGMRAILLTLVCIVFCILFESLFLRVTGRQDSINDLSAVVTGMLLSFNLPSSLPFWQAIIGCFFAIVVAKQIFGGIGNNFVNPAILGRVVLLISFPSTMTSWPLPKTGFLHSDMATGATPLYELSKGNLENLPNFSEMFIGLHGGSLGETGALAILLGGGFLLFTRIITPQIPLVFLGTMGLVAIVFGQNPLFHILAGGAMLGAFFMATDYTTAPLTSKGKIIFAIGCGFLTMMIRLFGAYPEGVSFAILFMNILTPHINRLTEHKVEGVA